MSTSAPIAPAQTAASVQSQPFEPLGLGAAYPAYIALLRRIEGRPQSLIRQELDAEIARLRTLPPDRETLSLLVVASVLRDYLACGLYPAVSHDRCRLVPVLEALNLEPAQRQALLRRIYLAGRREALRERGDIAWLRPTSEALARHPEQAPVVIEALRAGAPDLHVEQVTTSRHPDDPRGLWRAVRATWSMGPEASAPGREVALLVTDTHVRGTPLGILQFRNVVPEIRARDEWLGVTIGAPAHGEQVATGYLGLVGADPAASAERLTQTATVMRALLAHVRPDGLPAAPTTAALETLARAVRDAQRRSHSARRAGDRDRGVGALAVQKRAETALELRRGVDAARRAAAAVDPLSALAASEDLRRGLDSGLKKLWHYHMGFVAMELSICGAAPPFGPLRLGKLMALLAGAAEVAAAWGDTRPLGEIAQMTYDESVREAVPSPGPLVVFTSGLYPGHAAQYNRLACGNLRWQRVGATSGYGNFHVSRATSERMEALNEVVDGYRHVTRRFGEGANARFRSVGRALEALGLPDLRRHAIKRPLYALPLVPDPQAVLLGWAPSVARRQPAAQALSDHWWARWVAPRAAELAAKAAAAPTLAETLAALVADLEADT